MKVKMVPHVSILKDGASGIHTVVRAYFKHLPKYGVELVGPKEDNFDLLHVHAGMSENFPSGVPLVAMLHGLYWTADYAASSWEWDANKNVVESVRKATRVTVPSPWVSEAIRRDIRVQPTVIPHGIDWAEWQSKETNGGYVLAYAKNRAYADVCDPSFITDLATQFPGVGFIATFAPKDVPSNVEVIGVQKPAAMKKLIQRAACVISPIKETFGILSLEAMASGVPILGYAHGGNLDLIQHGVNGYLARVSDKADLALGLQYCLDHRETLGKNGREIVRAYTWEESCQKLANLYLEAIQPDPPTVAVIIPSYNYAQKVGRAIESALSQTYPQITHIVVVDDGSQDYGETQKVVLGYHDKDPRVSYIQQNNSGVAVARNNGISSVSAKYICCLDADDAIEPLFIEACVGELEKDRSLGIAYTGLMTCHQDGRRVPSPWPGKFNYDDQLQRRNQVPTCCVFRREMWRRLGGYRQRYAPAGCGSEDAEFWTRAGAYGWNAKQATEAPLFLYSVGTGYVSGNKHYHEPDWLYLHPWKNDGQHPFASVATPKRLSHPVRQYDEPGISVVIPVGPGHKNQVFNALDSLEGQTFKKWEVILVDDTGDPQEPWSFDGVQDVLPAYPYARVIITPGKKGAGYARNRGVEAARAPLVVFMDADDNFLTNQALEIMLDAYLRNATIVYSDYLGKAYIDKQEATRLEKIGRLLNYDERTGLALTKHSATDYDCERAVHQPSPPFYIWNLITSLFPRQWHTEIGGFDERMPSWEDWDYWVRMAKAGRCFTRVAEPLVVYRFYTGTRREEGIQLHQDLVQYLLEKYKEIPTMACGCGKKKTVVQVMQAPAQPQSRGVSQMEGAAMLDSEFVMISYDHPNRGQHHVVGPAIFSEQIAPNMIRSGGGFAFNYGYRGGGERFYAHRRDIEAMPSVFVPVMVVAPPAPVVPPPAPVAENAGNVAEKPVENEPEKPFDLQTLPGVTKAFSVLLAEKGYTTPECLIELGLEGLLEIDGMTERRAKTILAGSKKVIEANQNLR